MAGTIAVRMTDRRCPLGDAYAARHLTTPPKTAVLSCEGMCLRGEIARRAANLVAHELAPERAVRVCHGGLLETGGGMRDLVEKADQVVVLDGCSMACGTRLLQGAIPQVKPRVVFTDSLTTLDRAMFGVDEMPEPEIGARARAVAERVVADALPSRASGEAEGPASDAGTSCRPLPTRSAARAASFLS